MPLTLDLSITPFSRYGSRFSVSSIHWQSENPCGQGLYIRAHHGNRGPRGIFKLNLFDGRIVEPTAIEATPDAVRLRLNRRSVTICIESSGTIRIHGDGRLALRMEMPADKGGCIHPSPGGRWTYNCPHLHTKYMLEMKSGNAAVESPWQDFQCKHLAWTLIPDASGTFDAAIDEYSSVWTERERKPFASCVKESAREFDSWQKRLPSAPGKFREAREHAAYVMWGAVVEPKGLLKRTTMLMSKRQMDQVWSWDHCFNAMALAHGHPELAWDQFMIMADHQDSFGAYPDCINDEWALFNFCKPPIHGWALNYMMEQKPAFFTRERLSEAYETLSRWTQWWIKHRTWPGDEIPYYLHGNDSGWDNSTIFDHGCPVISPDLPASLAIQMETLGDLADRLGKKTDAAKWRKDSKQLIDAMVKLLWRDGIFVGLRRPDGFAVRCDSLIRCIPVVLGKRLPKEIRQALVDQVRTFLTPHGLATERTASQHYRADGYWRGPIWAPSTMMIVSGLAGLGEKKLVNTIAEHFCTMCARTGFAENYDAQIGVGLRDRSYTWTASVFLMLAHDHL